MIKGFILALAAVTLLSPDIKPEFDVSKAGLPADAHVCVAIEGTTKSECNVAVYEKASPTDANPEPQWTMMIATKGYLGKNGLNNYRVEGDKTTPIGIFKMNTPFGQSSAQPGFPVNYQQVSGDVFVWSDDYQKLVYDPSMKLKGERVGNAKYKGYYEYCIDLGYNPTAIPKKGSALFIHCGPENDHESSGCVQIKEELMAELIKIYGKYGEGCSYSAIYPKGKADKIYGTFGIFKGLSPNGDFK